MLKYTTKRILYSIVILFFVMFLIYVLMLPLGNSWQLFLIAVPAEILVFLACNIRKVPKVNQIVKKASK